MRFDLHARSTSDVFELDVSFDGPWAKTFGSSHEWYSPRTGFFRIERSFRDRDFASVYDGSTITRRANGKLFRVEGERAMLRSVVPQPNVFESPGLVAIRGYFDGFGKPYFDVEPQDGGGSLRVDWHYVDEGIDEHIHYTVRFRSRVRLRTARSKGVLAPLTGTLAGELKLFAPGTPPHFGEDAFWFGPKLPGGSRAVTALERWGADVLADEGSVADVRYTTIYQLPRSAVPPGTPNGTTGTYPGLGDERETDVWVECVPENSRSGRLALEGSSAPITLADGTRARLYVGGPRRFSVAVSGTVCSIRSSSGTDRLRQFADRLRPL